MASNSANKRRRTAADTLHISDLPVGFIADVSAYLSKPSRALLAVAFSEPSPSSKNNDYQLSPISAAIVSATQWDTLDFEDVEKELANKLTDDDIYAVLKCINAHDVLKRLKLCGCVNIEGHGLNPLRGSIVLEQIDISIVGKHEKPKIKPEPKISVVAVVPVLDSIIASDNCSLKHIQFPKKWYLHGYITTRREEEEQSSIARLKSRFDRHLNALDLRCGKCNDDRPLTLRNMKICYDCLVPICIRCRTWERCTTCDRCEKYHCSNCCASCYQCGNHKCNKCICSGCGGLEECDKCGKRCCEDCLPACKWRQQAPNDECYGCSNNICCCSCSDSEEYSEESLSD